MKLPFWLRTARKFVSVIFIAIFAFLSIQTFPYFPSTYVLSPISAWFVAPSQPSTVGTQIVLGDHQLPDTFPITSAARTLNLTFTLAGGPLVVGTALNLTVTMQADFTDIIADNVSKVVVTLDEALLFPFVKENGGTLEGGAGSAFTPSFNSFTFDLTNITGSCTGSCVIPPSALVFNKTEQVKYTISGSFGATVETIPFISQPTKDIYYNVSTYHTDVALFSIASYDTVLAKTNQQLTVCLTFVVLMFSAIAVYPDDGPPNYSKSAQITKP